MSSFGLNRRSHFTGNEFPLSRRFAVIFALIPSQIMWEFLRSTILFLDALRFHSLDTWSVGVIASPEKNDAMHAGRAGAGGQGGKWRRWHAENERGQEREGVWG